MTQAAEPVTGEPSDKPIIDPRSSAARSSSTRIDTEDFEVGAYVGILSIEDFESNVVYGARLAYHLTEDFFLEGDRGPVTRAGRTSYENLSGSGGPADRQRARLHVLRLSAGWNALPGEIFLGKNRAYNTAFYLVAGIGSTRSPATIASRSTAASAIGSCRRTGLQCISTCATTSTTSICWAKRRSSIT